jgi:SAM-dependent methyltransferase
MTPLRAFLLLLSLAVGLPAQQDDQVAGHFNKIYAAPADLFNKRPNAFVAAVTKDLPPGTALDVAMGQGRNAIFLASKGWRVTGFDIAEKGLEIAQAEAARLGLKITTIKSRYQDFDWGSAKWDLIVFSYAWVPLADPALIGRVRTSLKPGGLVVIEAPAEDPLKPVALREWPPEPTDEVNALPRVWTAGFRILRCDDVEDMCDWRNRKARIIRLLARKWAVGGEK